MIRYFLYIMKDEPTIIQSSNDPKNLLKEYHKNPNKSWIEDSTGEYFLEDDLIYIDGIPSYSDN